MSLNLRSAAILAAAFLAVSCSDSPSDPGGPATPAPRELDASTALEGTIAPGSAGDKFVLRFSDARFQILLQARGGSPADTLVADLVDASGRIVSSVSSVGGSAGYAGGDAQLVTPIPGESLKWKVRVRGHSANDQGAYYVRMAAYANAPEIAPLRLVPGQWLTTEGLDQRSDVDEFLIAAEAGQEILLQARSEGSPVAVRYTLLNPATGQVIAERIVGSGANATAYLYHVFAAAGEYSLRVAAANPNAASSGIPYGLRVDWINRAPESGTGALALGAVAVDSINISGDIDEFTFTAAEGQFVNVMLQPLDALGDGLGEYLVLHLVRDGEIVAGLAPQARVATLDDFGTGRLRLNAGVYTVRVSGRNSAGAPTGRTGRYRIELYPVDFRPETPVRVQPDSGLVSGALERAGDVDDYTFQVTAGQSYVMRALSPGTPTGALRAQFISPGEIPLAEIRMENPDGVASQPGTYSARIKPVVSGTYAVRVMSQPFAPLARASYSVEVYTINEGPEHVPATIRAGQTITAERIDRSGDLDVFRVEEATGGPVNLFVTAASGWALSTFVSGPDIPAPIFTYQGPSTLDGISTGRMTLSAGSVVSVSGAWMGGTAPASGGAYTLRLFAIDPAPEGRAAAYVLGTEVSGEPLYPAGDIDEYTFQLAATTRITATWDVVRDSPVFGTLLNDATGESVWTPLNNVNGVPIREFTLPAGRYRFRLLDRNAVAHSQTPLEARYDYRFSLTAN